MKTLHPTPTRDLPLPPLVPFLCTVSYEVPSQHQLLGPRSPPQSRISGHMRAREAAIELIFLSHWINFLKSYFHWVICYIKIFSELHWSYPRKWRPKWRLEIQLKISTWLPTSEGFPHFNLQPSQVTPLTGPTLKYYLSLVLVFFFNRKEGLPVWGSLIPCVCSKIINSLMNNYFIGSLVSEALSCVWRIPAPLWSLGGKQSSTLTTETADVKYPVTFPCDSRAWTCAWSVACPHSCSSLESRGSPEQHCSQQGSGTASTPGPLAAGAASGGSPRNVLTRPVLESAPGHLNSST